MRRMDPTDAETLAKRSPKVLLHEHLDGGLRVATLRELALARGLPLPAADEAGLAAWFDANAHAGSLEKYLEGFAMAPPEALRRVAREAADDAADDGVVLAEFRIAPLLFEPHGTGGDYAVEALLEGLAASRLPLLTHSGLIVCAMRHEDEAATMRAAALALRWMGRGVVGFDLAGAERERHALLQEYARRSDRETAGLQQGRSVHRLNTPGASARRWSGRPRPRSRSVT